MTKRSFPRAWSSNVDSSATEPAEEERPKGDRTERRGRRRRGRGRSRSPDQVQDEQTAGEDDAIDEGQGDFGDVEEEESAVEAEGSDEHDFDDEEEHDGEHDDDGGDSPRIGFRNIPTWQDAIGMMIAKNMEARARNPGGPRGSGGRGGRGGGGRGRGRRPDRR